MGTVVYFTAPLSISSPQRRFGHFSKLSVSLEFLSSRSPELFFSHSTRPNLGIRLKPSSSSLMATHLQVSENAPSEELGSSSTRAIGQHDLLIVGPGVLGRLVAEKWREEYPGCQVYGQTVTTDHHEELIKLGINPSLKWTEATKKFPYVIFCAPPTRSSDYPGDLRLAALSWNGEGSFLFTSSSAPYACDDNGACDEDSPVVPIGRSPRTDVLLKAENVVLDFDGCVLRLGAHAYWLGKGIVDTRPDHILNLIHYEDAASLSIAILKKKIHKRIFLGCDNHPLSRQELMDLVNQSGKFSKKFEKFTGTDGPLGKKLNNSRTRQEIGWEPKYTSFAHFLETL
ncbi:hypothetical protein L6164_025500 [Bauhinia variegata]|uniref:Uncharacterized protein n=1 Tax=Bauhinia variegata TaxID=167791 RepID=A0ACB9M131_BAUVA|nr:hypothetical protein L6164_025500 [Bauhinia variegata]